MMRTIFLLIMVAAMLTITSCGKNSSPTPSPPPPPPTPTLTVSLSPETAWYFGTSTISWATTNTDSVRINGVKVNSNSFVTPSLTAPASYTITAFGPGGSVTKTITVAVWSKNTTLISNHGTWKNIYSVRYKPADSLNPALYNYLPIDSVNCKTIYYSTNTLYYLGVFMGFKGQTMQGCGNSTVAGDFTWDWDNNETQIHYGIGPSVNWNVDTLNASLLRISQDRPDSTSAGTIFHYVLRFVH